MAKRSPDTFAGAMAAARAELRLSKTALGRNIGVTGKTIARWEEGRFMPSHQDRARIVAALAGMSPETESVIRAALGVARPAPGGAVPPAQTTAPIARFAVDSAVLAMAEKLPGVAIVTLRDVLDVALDRLSAANVALGTAVDVLRAGTSAETR